MPIMLVWLQKGTKRMRESDNDITEIQPELVLNAASFSATPNTYESVDVASAKTPAATTTSANYDVNNDVSKEKWPNLFRLVERTGTSEHQVVPPG